MFLVTFSKQAVKDKRLLKSAGLEKKTRILLDILCSDPFGNPPPYEKLIGVYAFMTVLPPSRRQMYRTSKM